MAPPSRIEFDVYGPDGSGAALGTLSKGNARSWTHQRSEAGSGGYTVPLSSAADVALSTKGNVVRCKLDGVVRHAFVVERRSRTRLVASKALPASLMVSGRGIASLLDQANIEPEREIGLISPQSRPFNFASRDFDSTSWPAATVIKTRTATSPAQWFITASDPAKDVPGPRNWPAQATGAKWIWAQPQATADRSSVVAAHTAATAAWADVAAAHTAALAADTAAGWVAAANAAETFAVRARTARTAYTSAAASADASGDATYAAAAGTAADSWMGAALSARDYVTAARTAAAAAGGGTYAAAEAAANVAYTSAAADESDADTDAGTADALPYGGTAPQPVGRCYFRGLMNLAAGTQGTYAFHITADDGYVLWVDGEIIGQETTAMMWGDTRRHDKFLDPGLHLVAIEAVNIERVSVATNIAGVLMSVVAVNGDGSLGAAIMNTDENWSALAYPGEAPTMSIGEIVLQLLDEAHNRGELLNITTDVTATLDSNGNEWAQAVDVTARVGDTYLSLLRQLAGYAVDFEVDAATDPMLLRVYNRGTMGGAGSTFTVDSAELLALSHDDELEYLNRALVQYANGGWVWIDDPAATGIVRSAFLQVGGASSDTSAERVVAGVFDQFGADGKASVRAALRTSTVDPYAATPVGGVCGLPQVDTDTPAAARVLSLTIADDTANTGNVIAGIVCEQPA